MLRKALGAGLAVVAMLGICAAPAGAGGGSAATQILDMTGNCNLEEPVPDDLCLYTGLIDSGKAKCVPNRTVRIFVLAAPDAHLELVDTTRTSRRGGFGGLGRPSDFSAFRVKVLRKVIRTKRGRIVCKAAALTSA
jgi:hypothetical protein